MLFRHLLTQSYQTGARGRRISKRSLKTIDESLSPVLLVDCSYLAFLLESRNGAKQSKIYNTLSEKLLNHITNPPISMSTTDKQNVYLVRDIVLELFTNSIRLIKPDQIILVYRSAENLLENEWSEKIIQAILDPLDLNKITLNNEKYSDFVFTFLQKYSSELKEKLLVYMTNSITTWACCSHTLQHGCIAFTKNLRPLFYTSKTGLDIVSKFINTSKIINKLGLDDVKYVNLQYLYIMLLYIKFLTHKEKDSTFFFDAKYFKLEKGVEYADFLRSKGSGLEMIAEAHKTLSYVFLTKPDLMDQFLFYTTHNFILNLGRLVRVTDFDRDLLSYLSNYYSSSDRLNPVSTLFSFSLATLIRDRTKRPNTKVKLFPRQYTPVLTALDSKRLPRKKEIPPKVFTNSTDIVYKDDEVISKILRDMLW